MSDKFEIAEQLILDMAKGKNEMDWINVLHKYRSLATASLEAKTKGIQNKEDPKPMAKQHQMGQSSSTTVPLEKSNVKVRPEKRHDQQRPDTGMDPRKIRPTPAEKPQNSNKKEAIVDPDTAWKKATNVITSVFSGPVIPEIMEDNKRNIGSTFKAMGIRPVVVSASQNQPISGSGRSRDLEKKMESMSSQSTIQKPTVQQPLAVTTDMPSSSSSALLSSAQLKNLGTGILSLWSLGSLNLSHLNALYALHSTRQSQLDREVLISGTNPILKEVKELALSGVIKSKEDLENLENIEKLLVGERPSQELQAIGGKAQSTTVSSEGLNAVAVNEGPATISSPPQASVAENENDVSEKIMKILRGSAPSVSPSNTSALRESESQESQYRMATSSEQKPYMAVPSPVSDPQTTKSSIISEFQKLVRSDPNLADEVVEQLKKRVQDTVSPPAEGVRDQGNSDSYLPGSRYSSPGFPVNNLELSTDHLSDVASTRYSSPGFPVQQHEERSTGQISNLVPTSQKAKSPTGLFTAPYFASKAYSSLSPVGATAVPPSAARPSSISGAASTVGYDMGPGRPRTLVDRAAGPARTVNLVHQPQPYGGRFAAKPPWNPQSIGTGRRHLLSTPPVPRRAILMDPPAPATTVSSQHEMTIIVENDQQHPATTYFVSPGDAAAQSWPPETWEQSRNSGQYPETAEDFESDNSNGTVRLEDDVVVPPGDDYFEEYAEVPAIQFAQQSMRRVPYQKSNRRGSYMMPKNTWSSQNKKRAHFGNRLAGYQPRKDGNRMQIPPPIPLIPNMDVAALGQDDLRLRLAAKRSLPPNDLRRKLPAKRWKPGDLNQDDTFGGDYQGGGFLPEGFYDGGEGSKPPVHQRLSFGRRGQNRSVRLNSRGAGANKFMKVPNEFAQSGIDFQDDPAYY